MAEAGDSVPSAAGEDPEVAVEAVVEAEAAAWTQDRPGRSYSRRGASSASSLMSGRVPRLLRRVKQENTSAQSRLRRPDCVLIHMRRRIADRKGKRCDFNVIVNISCIYTFLSLTDPSSAFREFD